jgi:hypothetical protein
VTDVTLSSETSNNTNVVKIITSEHAMSAMTVPIPMPLGSTATVPAVRAARDVVRRTGVTGRDSGDTARDGDTGLGAAFGAGVGLGGGFAAGLGAGVLGFSCTVDAPSSASASSASSKRRSSVRVSD